MPTKSRSKKSSRTASKKATRKVAKKAAKTGKKVAKKAAAKTRKKVAQKTAKKTGKKVAKRATGKTDRKGAKKPPRRPRGSRQKAVKVSTASRHEMIAKAAYYRAEKRSFQDGDPVADWLSAEQEVNAILSRTAH